jgi:signal transduction histidine kinase
MSVGSRLNARLTQLAVGRHLPRRTVRVRLTLLYGALFLLSGAVLLAITYVLFEQATQYRTPHLPKIPHTPAIQHLPQLAALQYQLTTHLPQLALDVHRVAQFQHQLTQHPSAYGGSSPLQTGPPLMVSVSRLAQDQHQLAQDQRQLVGAVHQLAQAVRQLAQGGSAEAAQRAADLHQLLVNSGIGLAIVAVLALLAGWFIAGRMLRPIRTITRRAQRISSTSLHERLALDGPQDELKELGDTLDDLFGRLDAAFEAQRHFVANASHELRTPLARQRALIQVALADPHASFSSLRAAHERVLVSEQHLERMIDALLTLTRGQAGPERHERLDLAALASEALLARESEAAGLELDVRATLSAAPAEGDPRLIERLIANLLDNALHHNTPGGYVEIATGTRDRHAFVSITNTGPAIPPEELRRLFQPFQRLNGTRTRHSSGHGLGLSIVHAIATAHRADLTTRARPSGGLTIEVSFPPPSGAGSEATFALPGRNTGARAPVPVSGAPGESAPPSVNTARRRTGSNSQIGAP